MDMHVFIIAATLITIVAVYISFVIGKRSVASESGAHVMTKEDYLNILKHISFPDKTSRYNISDLRENEFVFFSGDPAMNNLHISRADYLKQIVKEDLHLLDSSLVDLLKNGAVSVQYREHIKDPDSGQEKIVWYDCFAFVGIRDRKGTPLLSVAFFSDITDFVRKSQMLHYWKTLSSKFVFVMEFVMWSYREDTDVISIDTPSGDLLPEIKVNDYIMSIVHPSDRKLFREGIDGRGRHQTNKIDIIYRALFKNKWEWVHCQGDVVTEEGESVVIYGFTRVITKEHERSLQLKQEKEMLAYSLGSAKMLPWQYGFRDNTITIGLYDQSGEKKEYDKMKLDDFVKIYFYPEDFQVLGDFIERIRQGELNSFDLNVKCHAKSKSTTQWMNVKCEVSEYDQDGSPLTLSGLTHSLKDDPNYRLILEQNEQMDFVLKTSGIFALYYAISDDSITLLTGYDNLPQKISLFEYVSKHVAPENRATVMDNIEKIRSGETTSARFTYVHLDSLGHRFNCECIAKGSAPDASGNVQRIYCSIKDVSEEIKKVEELVSLRQKAEESNNLKSAFLANMSHEIRTPLNAIVGFSHLISSGEDPQQNEEFCKIVDQNSKLLLRLIDDVIDLSQLEAEKVKFVIEPVDICKLIEGVMESFRRKTSKNIELVCDLPDTDFFILTDGKRLKQVFDNLIGNAVKYTEKGYISVGYVSEEKVVRFFVRDTGIGISKDKIDQIFQHFMKVNSFKQGTGLGLCICQSIIEKLGGQTGVDSEEGKGSEFWFTLPKSSQLSVSKEINGGGAENN